MKTPLQITDFQELLAALHLKITDGNLSLDLSEEIRFEPFTGSLEGLTKKCAQPGGLLLRRNLEEHLKLKQALASLDTEPLPPLHSSP